VGNFIKSNKTPKNNMDINTEINICNLLIAEKYSEVKSLLANNSQHVNDKWLFDFCPLHIAAEQGNLEIVRMLIECGADVNALAKESLYETPLGLSARENHIDVCKYLLSCGACPDGMDETAITPLMAACQDDHYEIAKLLLEAGANVNRLGYLQRFTAFDFSKHLGSERLRSLLREFGAISVSEEIDWEKEEGYPIISYVSNEFGAVYPIYFEAETSLGKTKFRLAGQRSSPDYLMLFTFGLSGKGRKIEFSIILEKRWPLLNGYKSKHGKLSFPVDILEYFYNRALDDKEVFEWKIFNKHDSFLSNFSWPEKFDNFIFINYDWKNKIVVEDAVESSNSATIYTLMPIDNKIIEDNKLDAWLKKIKSRKKITWKNFAISSPVMY